MHFYKRTVWNGCSKVFSSLEGRSTCRCKQKNGDKGSRKRFINGWLNSSNKESTLWRLWSIERQKRLSTFPGHDLAKGPLWDVPKHLYRITDWSFDRSEKIGPKFYHTHKEPRICPKNGNSEWAHKNVWNTINEIHFLKPDQRLYQFYRPKVWKVVQEATNEHREHSLKHQAPQPSAANLTGSKCYVVNLNWSCHEFCGYLFVWTSNWTLLISYLRQVRQVRYLMVLPDSCSWSPSKLTEL